MLPALWYHNIYLIIVTLMTIIVTQQYRVFSNTRFSSRPQPASPITWLIPLGFAVFIGLRPISRIFVDMINYNSFYYAFGYGKGYTFSWDTENYLFDNLFYWLSGNMFAISTFFIIIAVIYFGAAYIACRKLFPRDAILAYIVFLAAFSTFSYATNGIKAGAAASLFLCAIAYRQHRLYCLLFLFLSLGFHHSMVLPISGFVLCTFLRKPKFYVYIWGFALIIALAHITTLQTLFAGMGNEQSASYLMNSDDAWGGKSGFRYDFVLYSAVPVILGYYAIIKKKLTDPTAIFIVNLYTFINAIWMMCMYANFTNRIAYLSWQLYPITLIIPYLIKPIIPNQYKKVNHIVWFQLCFTLAMSYIYYG